MFLDSMGIKAINTGCPTTWTLTPEHCCEIPIKKADNVVFTLTDYNQDTKNDPLLIELLLDNYKINMENYKPVSRLAGSNYSKIGEIFSIKR